MPVQKGKRMGLGHVRPFIVALGGTLREHSSTERAIGLIARRCRELGAEVLVLSGTDLDLPSYAPDNLVRTEAATRLIEALRRADAIILGSPGYHGGVSGLVKNAVDYVEDLRGDARCYLEGRAVACVATGAGWQGAITTLSALRAIVHALRGWPTPLGVAINTSEPTFTAEGTCVSQDLSQILDAVAGQLVEFVTSRALRNAA